MNEISHAIMEETTSPRAAVGRKAPLGRAMSRTLSRKGAIVLQKVLSMGRVSPDGPEPPRMALTGQLLRKWPRGVFTQPERYSDESDAWWPIMLKNSRWPFRAEDSGTYIAAICILDDATLIADTLKISIMRSSPPPPDTLYTLESSMMSSLFQIPETTHLTYLPTLLHLSLTMYTRSAVRTTRALIAHRMS
jgi:hypothetical protein